MKLAKLLLKLLYLCLLYFAILMIIKPSIDIPNHNLVVIVLSLSVLITHFTFDSIYDVVTKSEIIIKQQNDDADKHKKNSSKVEIVDKVHKEASSDYLFDHTHKFIKEKVFD